MKRNIFEELKQGLKEIEQHREGTLNLVERQVLTEHNVFWKSICHIQNPSIERRRIGKGIHLYIYRDGDKEYVVNWGSIDAQEAQAWLEKIIGAKK